MVRGRGRDPPGRGGAQALKGCWIACWISLRETGFQPALWVHRQRPCEATHAWLPSGSTTFPHRPGLRPISSNVYLKFVHMGTAALRWPLLLHHLTGIRLVVRKRNNGSARGTAHSCQFPATKDGTISRMPRIGPGRG